MEKRPEKPELQRTVVRGKAKLTSNEGMQDLQMKYVENHCKNENIPECCRDKENLSVELFNTDPDVDGANMIRFTCDECGRKHVRVAAGAGKVG